MNDTGSDDIAGIYHALKRGVGREHVTDGNVRGLIRMAEEYGDAQLEYLLREWVSTCGEDKNLPELEQSLKAVPPSHAKG